MESVCARARCSRVLARLADAFPFPTLRITQRQVQVHGHKVPMEEMTRLIDAVTLADLYRVAGRVLRPKSSSLLSDRQKNGKPTIVVQGQLEGLPDVVGALRRRGLAGDA